MKKKDEILKKVQKNSRKRKKKELDRSVLTPEQQAFLEREEKIDKINEKLNRPIIGITYICALLIIGLMVYIMHFMIVDKDEVIANAANSRLDRYAADVIRGDIVTSDGKTIATNDGDTRYYPYDNLFAHVAGYSKYTKAGIELVGNYYLLESHANIIERAIHTLRREK